MPAPCDHLETAMSHNAVKPTGHGCVECLKSGDIWVHLRLCMTCGHVGCCDNSPNRHATKHFHATSHPVIWAEADLSLAACPCGTVWTDNLGA